jgi:hypothetical protein
MRKEKSDHLLHLQLFGGGQLLKLMITDEIYCSNEIMPHET